MPPDFPSAASVKAVQMAETRGLGQIRVFTGLKYARGLIRVLQGPYKTFVYGARDQGEGCYGTNAQQRRN